jgi:hypothetical protein
MVSANAFDFLSLPPELRNRVYSFAIPHGFLYDLRHRDDDSEYPKWIAHIPTLCQASQQLRRDTISIWRANNYFKTVQLADHDRKKRESGISPSMEEFLVPHLEGGFEHTRHLHWAVLLDRVFVREGRYVSVYRDFQLDGNHWKLHVNFNHDAMPDPRCLLIRKPLVKRLIESKILAMLYTVQQLVGRNLT